MTTEERNAWPVALCAPRMRVLTDNDYSGDPDGLVQLAQLLLSPSVEVVGIIGSHLPLGDDWSRTPTSADDAVVAATDLAGRCGRSDVRVAGGTNGRLVAPEEPIRTAATDMIIAEAMRTDTDLPLYITVGGGLTELASAWLLEPRIAERCTVVWIGGHEHDGLAQPPEPGMDMEYNTGIDPIAAQVIFNESSFDIWQVPRDVYRQTLASRAELLTRMYASGPLGAFLFDALGTAASMAKGWGVNTGEAYVLGDSPLVSLVALQTAFERGPASSFWVDMPCPRILNTGLYESRPDGRSLRVFTRIDNRLMLEDLYAKLSMHTLGLR